MSQDFDLVKFRKLLAELFSNDELNTLCFDLSIEYENLAGDTRDGKTRELVKYCYRNGKLPDLLQLCQAARPKVVWVPAEQPEEPDEQESSVDLPLQAYYQLVKAFNRNRHLPYSGKRTFDGDDIAFHMRELAPTVFGKFDVAHWLQNKSTGKRLAAVAYLNWAQDVEFFEDLVERLFVERPFIQFHILLTLNNMVDQLDDDQEQFLHERLSKYETSGDGSRGYWKNHILEAIAK